MLEELVYFSNAAAHRYPPYRPQSRERGTPARGHIRRRSRGERYTEAFSTLISKQDRKNAPSAETVGRADEGVGDAGFAGGVAGVRDDVQVRFGPRAMQ